MEALTNINYVDCCIGYRVLMFKVLRKLWVECSSFLIIGFQIRATAQVELPASFCSDSGVETIFSMFFFFFCPHPGPFDYELCSICNNNNNSYYTRSAMNELSACAPNLLSTNSRYTWDFDIEHTFRHVRENECILLYTRN